MSKSYAYAQTPPSFGTAVTADASAEERFVIASITVTPTAVTASSVETEVETGIGTGTYTAIARTRAGAGLAAGVTETVCFFVPGGRRYRFVEVDTGGSRTINYYSYRDSVAVEAGNGLSFNGDTLNVNVDSATVGIDGSDQVYVLDDGITTAKIDDGAVTAAKVAADVATQAELDTHAGLDTGIHGVGASTVESASGAQSKADAAQAAAEATAASELATHEGTAAGVHGVTGDVVGTTDTQTLSNKTLGNDLNAGGFKVTNLGAPTADNDAVRKVYADSLKQGLDMKDSVRAATAAALPVNTPSGSGVGKTLTADADGALSVDGVTVAVDDRVLVKDEATASHNGVYAVTATGGVSDPWVLTRAVDADEDAEVTSGMYVFVSEGSANAGTAFVLTSTDPVTVDSSDQVFTAFSSVAIIAGDGLSKAGNTLSVNVDGVKIEVDGSDALTLVAGGVDTADLADGAVTPAKTSSADAATGGAPT